MDIDIEFNSCAFDDSDRYESTKKIDSKSIRLSPKRTLLNKLKKEKASEILADIPKIGESIHIIGNGSFDYWNLVPVMLEYLGKSDKSLFSTWTLNRENANSLFELMDRGKLENVSFITGLYFKRRESAVYATLIKGLQKRKSRYTAIKNHSKIALLCNKESGNYIVMEGSANFTKNPRIENYVISNDKSLFDFHSEWMEEVVNG